MRRLEFLANQVRKSTDNTDTNGISNEELQGYYNDAQKYIQALIFKSNPDADFFKAESVQAFNGTNTYVLPDDCYSQNSIYSVELQYNTSGINDGYTRIKRIQQSERTQTFGYFVVNNQVVISGEAEQSNYQNIRITYFRNLKTLGFRQQKVQSVVAGVSITLVSIPEFLYNVDDHISTVDAEGAQVVSDIYFTNTSGSVLSTTATAGVNNTQWVVSGKNGTNKCELPEACEVYLQDYVRQRIYTRNNYEDANKQLYFTEQQKLDIVSLFSKNKKDDDLNPITDVDFLTW